MGFRGDERHRLQGISGRSFGDKNGGRRGGGFCQGRHDARQETADMVSPKRRNKVAGKCRRCIAPGPRVSFLKYNWAMNLSVVLMVTKAAGALSRKLGRGGGHALPGLLAEKLDPELAKK